MQAYSANLGRNNGKLTNFTHRTTRTPNKATKFVNGDLRQCREFGEAQHNQHSLSALATKASRPCNRRLSPEKDINAEKYQTCPKYSKIALPYNFGEGIGKCQLLILFNPCKSPSLQSFKSASTEVLRSAWLGKGANRFKYIKIPPAYFTTTNDQEPTIVQLKLLGNNELLV